MNKSMKKFLAVMLAFAVVFAGAGVSLIQGGTASAAKKSKKVTLKLNKTSTVFL